MVCPMPKVCFSQEGTLMLKWVEQEFVVHKDDSLYFDASVEHEFHNSGEIPVEYYIVFKHPAN